MQEPVDAGEPRPEIELEEIDYMPTDKVKEDRRAHQEVRLTDETIQYLRQQIAEAVALGIKEAIKEALKEDSVQQFWFVGFSTLQKHASQKAGNFVLGSLWGLAKKGIMIAFIMSMIYSVGGFGALIGAVKSIFGGPK
jgi:hypothetical protein